MLVGFVVAEKARNVVQRALSPRVAFQLVSIELSPRPSQHDRKRAQQRSSGLRQLRSGSSQSGFIGTFPVWSVALQSPAGKVRKAGVAWTGRRSDHLSADMHDEYRGWSGRFDGRPGARRRSGSIGCLKHRTSSTAGT